MVSAKNTDAVPVIVTVSWSPFCRLGRVGEMIVCSELDGGKLRESRFTIPANPLLVGLPKNLMFSVTVLDSKFPSTRTTFDPM
jgi:hypothetical protein